MDTERVQRVPSLPARDRGGHKGNYGHVLIVGGSLPMPGAVALAANAALRGGAGLVTFAAPDCVQLAVAALCPCATSVPLASTADGAMGRGALAQVRQAAEKCDVLAVGPGMGVGRAQEEIVRNVLELSADKAVVLDADGLNNLARAGDWWQHRRSPLVLTPHPGEFARLTGRSVQDIQSDRERAAAMAADGWSKSDVPDAGELVLVLKGAGTVVTDGRRVYVNDTGNPGMATGGSGDVLTGLTAALLAQGLAPFDAAVLAVHAHGRAGDLAAEQLGEVSLIATDLIDHLPAALREA